MRSALRPLPLLLLPLLSLAAAGAGAVVHTTGDGSGNAAPPPDDPGFANVGATANGLSGVYLGNRWVLTASHVGEQAFTFGGVEYPVVVGARQRIWKDGVRADLAMVELAGPPPPLPDVALSSASPGVGDVVTLVGNGWSREAQPSCWDGSWNEVACPGGLRSGYERSGGKRIRWGVNVITQAGVDLPLGPTWTRAFGTVFDAAGMPDEAQIVNGDSGGAAFLERDGRWELVGIHFALIPYAGQPGSVAAFGNSGWSADVFHYRPEIEAVLSAVDAVPLAPWPLFALAGAGLLAVARRALAPRGR